MDFGNKIASLRKKNNFTQEELAERVGVTRQTISKWELNETSPDISQAKILSKVFNVSLDELTCNDINSILVTKISNTEKLAGITIKILKIIGIGILAVVGILIIIFFLNYNASEKDYKVVGKFSISCKLDDKKYLYTVEYNKNYQAIYSGGDAWIANHIDVEKYEDANQIVAHIDDYFKEHDGTCTITN